MADGSSSQDAFSRGGWHKSNFFGGAFTRGSITVSPSDTTAYLFGDIESRSDTPAFVTSAENTASAYLYAYLEGIIRSDTAAFLEGDF